MLCYPLQLFYCTSCEAGVLLRVRLGSLTGQIKDSPGVQKATAAVQEPKCQEPLG